VALKRAFRLRKNTDFQRVRQQGRVIASRLLILTCAPNDLATVRIGFVVSRRVSKHAVDRNYIKRLLSEVVRPVLAELTPGWDIVISAKHSALNNSQLPILTQDVRYLLRRARLLTPLARPEQEGAELKTHRGSET
jgi:ribonuclease P protein component